MAEYIVYYRKPKFHETYYPWNKLIDTAQEAVDFIESLGEDYDVQVFAEIELDVLYERAEGRRRR